VDARGFACARSASDAVWIRQGQHFQRLLTFRPDPPVTTYVEWPRGERAARRLDRAHRTGTRRVRGQSEHPVAGEPQAHKISVLFWIMLAVAWAGFALIVGLLALGWVHRKKHGLHLGRGDKAGAGPPPHTVPAAEGERAAGGRRAHVPWSGAEIAWAVL